MIIKIIYIYNHILNIISCDINWNEGKNLTVTVETKKQRRKGTNQTRIIKRTIPAETFFSFFNPPVIPDNEALEMDEDEVSTLKYIFI